MDGYYQEMRAAPHRIAAMKVHPGGGGSFVVVELLPKFEAYIDARKDVRQPHASFIEVVLHGMVRHQECVHNDKAPKAIIELMKEWRG